jgi:tetratricopeptide (TPR) repeat protein
VERKIYVLLPIFLTLLVLLFSGCTRENKERLERMLTWEARDAKNAVPEERIAEIREALEEYQEELDRKVKAGMEVGIYYRTLGTEYMNLEMYGLALEAFKEALFYLPASGSLHYQAGICAGQMAKATVDGAETAEFLRQAEAYYRRALELSPRDWDAAYALGVLYYFELENPLEAEKVLAPIASENPENYRARMLLGTVQAALGDVDRAIQSYEAVAEGSEDPSLAEAAMKNRAVLLGSQP